MLFAVIAPLVLVTWTGRQWLLRSAGDRGLYQGTLLSASEKDALNICYIRNASLGFDLRVIGMIAGLGKSDWRGEDALAQALKLHHQEPDSSEVLSTWSITAHAVHPDEAEQHVARTKPLRNKVKYLPNLNSDRRW
jgi:hypothetical protein